MDQLKNLGPSTEDLAAGDWGKYLPVFRIMVEKLSNRGVSRLLKALIEFPIEGEPKFPNQLEREAFKIGCHLMDCKQVMFSAVIGERLKNESKEKEENGKVVTTG